MWRCSGRARARPDPNAARGHGSRCHEVAAPLSPTRLCDVLRPFLSLLRRRKVVAHRRWHARTAEARSPGAGRTHAPGHQRDQIQGELQASHCREILAKYPQIKQLSSWIRGPFSRRLSIQGKGEARSLLCAAWTAVSLCH